MFSLHRTLKLLNEISFLYRNKNIYKCNSTYKITYKQIHKNKLKNKNKS